MKIILSRKGFDSKYGGVASPIFQQNGGYFTLYSLPIPLERATCGYDDILWNGNNLMQLIASLRRKKRTPMPNTPHLDPDLVREALTIRHPDWRPIFGQSGNQEQQLRNMGVENPKDPKNRPLFLFFGWYRRAEQIDDDYCYVKGAKNIHAVFGWLQLELKITLAGRGDRNNVIREMPWAATHPHVSCDYYDNLRNAVYIAPMPGSDGDRLILNGRDTGLPASGMFQRFVPEVHNLTTENKTRRHWRLPSWFYRDGEPLLGMHTDRGRWSTIPNDPKHVELRSVDRGQEFVFDSRDYKREEDVFNWVETLVRAGQPGDHVGVVANM